jgi:hypothetical protein
MGEESAWGKFDFPLDHFFWRKKIPFSFRGKKSATAPGFPLVPDDGGWVFTHPHA